MLGLVIFVNQILMDHQMVAFCSAAIDAGIRSVLSMSSGSVS